MLRADGRQERPGSQGNPIVRLRIRLIQHDAAIHRALSVLQRSHTRICWLQFDGTSTLASLSVGVLTPVHALAHLMLLLERDPSVLGVDVESEAASLADSDLGDQ